ncbi:MAG: histidine phosphatase family protein [Gaiellaceae bacterium]
METLFLARHAESELSVDGIVNGDPGVPCGLTARGEAQARALGRTLRGQPLELAVTSDFERCRQTARLALAGRDVGRLELPGLGDVRNGIYEGRPIDDYRRWADGAAASEAPPGGGESRAAAAERLAAAVRALLARPETTTLAVSHQLPVGMLLAAAAGRAPTRRIDAVPHARAFALTAAELERAAETLEAWAARPDW